MVEADEFSYDAVRTPMDLPIAKKEVIAAVERTREGCEAAHDGRERSARSNGTGRLYSYDHGSNHDNNQHSSNENIRQRNLSIPGLPLYRRTSATACYPGTYEPSLNVFVQGKKRVTLGGTPYLCDESTFLLSSLDLPVVSQIVEASEQVPLLSFLLKLDMVAVREILTSAEFHVPNGSVQDPGIAIGKTTVVLLKPCSRLLDLLDAPEDIPFLSSLIQREIIYRLLRGPQGARLRSIATLGDQSHRTAKAIAWLRPNYTKPLRLEELADVARMGMSTLHHHFRALTAMSPLQYQKQLRLVAARERMLIEGLDAATAAFEVGYESPSQFNREYKRFFGQPPIRDIKARGFSEFTMIRGDA